MLKKKKSYFNWLDKQRQITRYSQTCMQHLAFDNLEAACRQYQQNYIFSFIQFGRLISKSRSAL